MTRRLLFAIAAFVLLLLAWKLPTGWYDTLPRQADTPPLPFRGVSLLRATFLVESIVFFLLAISNWTYRQIPLAKLLSLPLKAEPASDLSRRNASLAVVILTLVAILLRAYHLGSDLWLDEITPVMDYVPMPFVQVVGSYLRTNNHLLNTILVKLSIGMFGESEWSIRFPAMLLGAATIPAFYWLARVVLSRWASVAATAVLATSYHHVFFSQNSRGYSAYLFFAIVTAGLLIRALSDDKSWRWILYIIAMVLGFASLAHMAFVFAAHVLVAAVAAVQVRRRSGSSAALVRRLLMVFGAAGFLSFQLYAAPLPEMYAVITHLYVREATGYAPFSREFLHELIIGVAAGFGGIIPAMIIAIIGFAGIAYLFRKNWLVTSMLALPPILTAGFLLVRGLSFSPRFFLLLVPLGILTIMALAEAGNKPRHAALFGAVVSIASLVSLVSYYRTPKQSYRSAIRYLESTRTSDDKVVVVYAAEGGIRYYLRRTGARDTAAYTYARTVPKFDSAVSNPQTKLVVTTFPRVLHADLPDVYHHIEREWRAKQVFPATIGDGEITVWERK
jgi:hypothetical protein